VTNEASDVAKIVIEGERLGLELNRAKCEIISTDQSRTVMNDFPEFCGFHVMSLDDLTLLGAPVQPGQAVDTALEAICEDLTRAVSRLSLVHTHDALIILRNSLSVPKLKYTLRTVEFVVDRRYKDSMTYYVTVFPASLRSVCRMTSGPRHPFQLEVGVWGSGVLPCWPRQLSWLLL